MRTLRGGFVVQNIHPQARLIQFYPPKNSTVLTSKGPVEVRAVGHYAFEKIYSVVDSQGLVVRSMHDWLSKLNKEIGLSRSEGTVEQYGKALTYLCRWIEAKPPYSKLGVEQNIAHLTREDLVRWLRFMNETGAKSRKTLRLRETAVKEFLLWLSTQEGGNRRSQLESPYGRPGTLKGIIKASSPKSPKFLPASVIISVLKGFKNECERCMFHFQYDAGLRISELIALKMRDIPPLSPFSEAHEFIPLCVSGVKGRAGGLKERITLVSRAVLKRLKRYHSSREYRLAPGWNIDDGNKPAFLTVNGLPWTMRNASKQFKSAIRRSAAGESFCTHWMRHGTAFSVLRSDMGKDYQDKMLIVMRMLGHNDVRTSQIYTQVSPAMLSELTPTGTALSRLSEAEEIRAQTYLAPLKHAEKRGHHAYIGSGRPSSLPASSDSDISSCSITLGVRSVKGGTG